LALTILTTLTSIFAIIWNRWTSSLTKTFYLYFGKVVSSHKGQYFSPRNYWNKRLHISP
jgi:hypothetical protein